MEKPVSLRPELPPVPGRMAHLPLDERGYPVPAFVAWIDGKPEFRVANAQFRELALRKELCWVCGQPFSTRHRHYVVGPMCVVNRTTSEPPVHIECAMFSIGGCPFLMRPHAVRRANDLPVEKTNQAGYIDRNPGVMVLYTTRERKVYRTGPYVGEYLLFLGEPEDVQWWTQGRAAIYVEAVASIHSGVSLLIAEAEKQDIEERSGGLAVEELRRYVQRMCESLPRVGRDDETAQNQLIDMGLMLGSAYNRVREASGE